MQRMPGRAARTRQILSLVRLATNLLITDPLATNLLVKPRYRLPGAGIKLFAFALHDICSQSRGHRQPPLPQSIRAARPRADRGRGGRASAGDCRSRACGPRRAEHGSGAHLDTHLVDDRAAVANRRLRRGKVYIKGILNQGCSEGSPA